MKRAIGWLLFPVAVLSTGCATSAQEDKTVKQAGEIAVQPAKDVGAVPTKVPPVLQEAADAPYSLEGLRKCTQLAAAIAALNEKLGPDYSGDAEIEKKRKVRVTGGMVAGLIVPFRGIVREVSGAAPAERELNAAVDAGLARRGFLHGVYQSRRCRPEL